MLVFNLIQIIYTAYVILILQLQCFWKFPIQIV